MRQSRLTGKTKLQSDIHLSYEVLHRHASGGIAHWRTTYQVTSEELFRIWAASSGTTLLARKDGDPLPRLVLDGVAVVEFDAIDVAAIVHFGKAGTTPNPLDPSKASHLVTEGIFRVSRNPMYLGLLLLLIGWAVWLGSASPWLVPPLFVVVITLVQIIPEEQALSRNFGEQYALYRRSVARWIGWRR